MKIIIRACGICWFIFAHGQGLAAEGAIPVGVPRFNHIFLVVMENHRYADIRGNPLAPFINELADNAAVAANYFAVTHPSLHNYLALVGGSDFNVASDNPPDWHNTLCTPFTDTGTVCPISGSGTETSTSTANIRGKSIAEQLITANKTWKTYAQGLPASGVDGVNFSDGVYSNLTDSTAIIPVTVPATTQNDMLGLIPALYAVKHNPFVYFSSGQTSDSLARHAAFEGANGLYADLRAGKIANLSLVVPDQCNDQHGVGNTNSYCSYDPYLIERGDRSVKQIVTAIETSRSWKAGNNAIIVVWDEDDYSASNQVLLIIDTNRGSTPAVSNTAYNHYSLLKTLEAGFRLPCLNHACDNSINVMTDLFNFTGSHF